MLLLALLLSGPASAQALLPTAPPVTVHTSVEERTYLGLGYLRFGVTLEIEAEPEWTLGGDEDARFPVGDARFTANGLGIAWGKTASDRSIEHAILGGLLGGAFADDYRGFYRSGEFISVMDYERRGGFVAYRFGGAWRVTGEERLFLDIGMTQLVGLYAFGGHSRYDSTGGVASYTTYGYPMPRYVTDFDEKTLGLAWRPVLTLQPHLPIGKRLAIIPFGGVSAFFAFSTSHTTVNEWEDELYGPDCFDGCEDNTGTVHPLANVFGGFDVEVRLFEKDTLSLASLLRPPSATDGGIVSEIYVVYGRGF